MCKAHGSEQDPEPPKETSYSRKWFGEFLKDALSSNNIPGACARAGVTMVELMRARATDPAIDAAMVEVDELSRLMAINAVTMAAAGGDLRAVKALVDGTLDVLTKGLHPQESPQVARAMADAKRRVLAGEAPRAWGVIPVVCPCCNELMTLELRDVVEQGRRTDYEVLLIQYGAADGSRPSRFWWSKADRFYKAAKDTTPGTGTGATPNA